MMNPRYDYPELFEWLMMSLDPQTPMARIEAIEQAEETIQAVANGELAVVHTTKSMFRSYAQAGKSYFLLDTLKLDALKKDVPNDTDDGDDGAGAA